jgi:hypothetical protein
MMNESKLTLAEWELLKQSLEYTRRAFEEYIYPSYDLKIARLKEVNDLRAKITAIMKSERTANGNTKH